MDKELGDLDTVLSSSIRWLEEYTQNDSRVALGLVFNYSSWNTRIAEVTEQSRYSFMQQVAERLLKRLSCRKFVSCRQIDLSAESLERYVCDNDFFQNGKHNKQWIPPESLPVLSLILSQENSPIIIQYLANISSQSLEKALVAFSLLSDDTDCRQQQRRRHPTIIDICSMLSTHVDQFADMYKIGIDFTHSSETIRIFIAGDRSSVGKSSVCLGILGNLLAQGYKPEDLAYIKPATQSESTQLVQLYCNKYGIACVPVGPLVYYRGFTRAFLANETQSTDELLEMCGRSVDHIAVGKRVVLVDGVGFPAVGSICGTDNASVLKACSYPILNDDGEILSRKPMAVVLVGGGGVGSAVDAFNLNASYFSAAGVKVIGGIFNKLDLSGFYSLENCRDQVTKYFDTNEEQVRLGRRPFGFVPLFPNIAGKDAIDHVNEFIQLFGLHVDIPTILQIAQQVRDENHSPRPFKQRRVEIQRKGKLRNRVDIEMNAINAGAAPSA